MSGFKAINIANDTITKAPSGALLTTEPKILFDGKTVTSDDTTFLWESIGTGTFTWANNKMNMSVTAGQYCIRQSRRMMPYFSGSPLLIEETFDTMNIQANVIKRIGYFSSNAAAPYQSNLDGFWFEMDGTTYRLKAARNGTSTVDVPFVSWDNYQLLSTYDFNNFTAIYFDFLWLGGAALRIWVCTPDLGWVLGHSAKYIGNNQDTICLNPSQPLRYSIVSSTGTGSLRQICSQASSASDGASIGDNIPIVGTAPITTNSIGTIYALLGFKKNSTYKNTPIKIMEFGCVNNTNNDFGVLMLIRNPTLSAPLTYSAYEKLDRAIATNQTVTAGTGIILGAVGSGTDTNQVLADNYRSWLTQTIGNTFDEYILCYQSTSNNQAVQPYVKLKQY